MNAMDNKKTYYIQKEWECSSGQYGLTLRYEKQVRSVKEKQALLVAKRFYLAFFYCLVVGLIKVLIIQETIELPQRRQAKPDIDMWKISLLPKALYNFTCDSFKCTN
jgi:hypothetical protein